MGTPNSVQLLQQMAGYDFEAQEQEISVLHSNVQLERIRLLDATVEALKPQLKYVTDVPGTDEEVKSPYAVVIRENDETMRNGLYILRSGKWLSVPSEWHKRSPFRERIKTISTEEALVEHDLETIQDGLAAIFTDALEKIMERKQRLTARLEKLQAARQALG